MGVPSLLSNDALGRLGFDITSLNSSLNSSLLTLPETSPTLLPQLLYQTKPDRMQQTS